MTTEQKQVLLTDIEAKGAINRAATRVMRARSAYHAAPSDAGLDEVRAAEAAQDAAKAAQKVTARAAADVMAGRPVKRGCGYPGCTGVGCASGHA